MPKYSIFEGNLERLEKKLSTIANKCKKYGAQFTYQKVDEYYKEVVTEDGESFTGKFIVVDVEGVAKVDGWRFIATLEHTEEGNIIHTYGDISIEVPSKYYTSDIICEHCNSKRHRKATYIIYNDDTQEWKQVGSSCLRDFTCGLDADFVASYISYFETLIEGEAPSAGSIALNKYYPVEDILLYAAECVKKFGYCKRDTLRPTADRCFDYYRVNEGLIKSSQFIDVDKIKMEMAECQFWPGNNRDIVEAAINWVLNEVEDDESYFHNLKVICKAGYVTTRNLGILVSLIPSYHRHLKDVERQQKEAEIAAACPSKHIGEVGDKVEFDSTADCVATIPGDYGVSYLYKLVDSEGNIYTWFTSKWLDEGVTYHIKGTVKGHDEFRGCKQTQLTRCRVKEVA